MKFLASTIFRAPAPFSEKERDRRYKFVRELMAKQGIDSLVLSAAGGARDFRGAVRYLSNYFVSGRFGFLVFPLEGDPIGIWNKSPGQASEGGWIQDVRHTGTPGLASPDYAPKLVKACKDLKLEKKTIGLVGHNFCFPSSVYDTVKKKLPKAKFKPADSLLEKARAIKSDDEVKAFKFGIDIALKAFERFCQVAKPGRTERQIYAEIVSSIIEAGAEYNTLVLIPGSGNPIIRGQWDRPLQMGDSFVYYPEFAEPRGYWIHHGRTVSIGTPPTREMENAFNKMLYYEDIGIKKLVPGNKACDVWNAISDALKKDGCPTAPWYGHAMGLDNTERPYITPQDKTVIKEGMTIALHPITPSFAWSAGLVCADLYHVTASGAKQLNPPNEYKVI